MNETKLVIAIFNPDDEERLATALTKEKFGITLTSGHGGFLNKKTSIAYIGAEEKAIPRVIDIIKKTCRSRSEFAPSAPILSDPGDLVVSSPVKVVIGGAIVFVVDAEMFKL